MCKGCLGGGGNMTSGHLPRIGGLRKMSLRSGDRAILYAPSHRCAEDLARAWGQLFPKTSI
jgi:hypothetical protein